MSFCCGEARDRQWITRLDGAILEAVKLAPPKMRTVIAAFQALRGIAHAAAVKWSPNWPSHFLFVSDSPGTRPRPVFFLPPPMENVSWSNRPVLIIPNQSLTVKRGRISECSAR
jgi:hypothetical protein